MFFESSGLFEYFYYKKLAEREAKERIQEEYVDKQQALIDNIKQYVRDNKQSYNRP